MPDPNDRDPNDRIDDGGGGSHPFLTEKGLRLQQLGPRTDNSLPMTMPAYPPMDSYGSGAIPIEVETAPTDPFDFRADADKPIHNVRPSRKFPDPAKLARTPLTRYFETAPIVATKSSPLRAIGKLFIQIASDARLPLAMGSAWITGPSTIATAAHNLYDVTTRTWSRALEFHPAYDYYKTGTSLSCRVTSCYLPRTYMSNPATNHDVAICYVDRNIGDIVGHAIEMETITDEDFFNDNPVAIVGYPAGSGFDFGKQLWRSRGEYLFGQGSGQINGIDSDFAPVMATNFGGGASGCPWLAEDKLAGPGKYKAVGVTSGHAKLRYARGELNLNSLVSPYFGPKMFDLLNDDQVFHEFS